MLVIFSYSLLSFKLIIVAMRMQPIWSWWCSTSWGRVGCRWPVTGWFPYSPADVGHFRWWVWHLWTTSTICILCTVHRVSKKKLQNCFCPNLVKFPPTFIIFGTLIAERINLCDVDLFSTSPNSRQRPTVLNASVRKRTSVFNTVVCWR